MRKRPVLFPIALSSLSWFAPSGLISTVAQPVSIQGSIFENVTLSSNFSPDPTTVRGISGGPLLASDISGRQDTATGSCIGYIDEQPDHRMVLTEPFNFLSLQIQSPENTTLVVRGPGGSWCNDDYVDMNPALAGQWLSGTYEIWVGSYNRNAYHPYIIRISANETP
jgi:hypothetical protein